ncbi:MAG TPA: hypothetical protein VF990_05110 [Candidatus Dormibacteraeota bacterium]
MRRLVCVLSLVLVTACSAAPTGVRTSPTPTASVTAPGSPYPSRVLFAVLETKRAGAQESEYAGSHDTIAIAGSDGFAVARATFVPRHIPVIPMAGAVLYPEAYPAAGGVYFIDGAGVVRRLDPSGSTRKVTTFPITSPQQGVSFAVSPDGKQLIAAVLTYPSVAPAPSPSAGEAPGPPFITTGSWMLDLEVATDGGSAAVVHHWQSGANDYPGSSSGFRNLAIVGWDATGPIGMIDGYNGVQQTLFEGQRWAGGHLIRLGLDGTLGAPTLSADCTPVALGDGGRVACLLPGAGAHTDLLQVARLDGTVLWTAIQPTQHIQTAQYGGFTLSPDGTLVAMDGVLVPQHGVDVPLPESFMTRGWLSRDTLIGLTQGTEPMKIGILRLNAATSIENWGFSGQFVGVLRP